MAQACLRTAMIGVGAWGRVLAKSASQSAKIEFVCCVGRNPERLAAFAKDNGIPARGAFDAQTREDVFNPLELVFLNNDGCFYH